jgi:hypothetical protein
MARSMTRRSANKRAARIARGYRRDMVHAAGCSFRGAEKCSTILAFVDSSDVKRWWDEGWAKLPAKPRRVSVPRSLRPVLGRWVGA